MSEPNFWEEIQEHVVGETAGCAWWPRSASQLPPAIHSTACKRLIKRASANINTISGTSTAISIESETAAVQIAHWLSGFWG